MPGVDVTAQEFVVVLAPGDTDYDTFRSCAETHFDLGGFQRLIPAMSQNLTVYQGRDQRQLRIEGNRLVLGGVQWERESDRCASRLDDLCSITGVNVVASGVNPTFSTEVSARHVLSLVNPGSLLIRLLGEQLQLRGVRVAAPRDLGRLTYNVSFMGGTPMTLRVEANWHEDHNGVAECVRRLGQYANQVRRLREDLAGALQEADDGD